MIKILFALGPALVSLAAVTPARALPVFDCALALAPDRASMDFDSARARRTEVLTRLSEIETSRADFLRELTDLKSKWASGFSFAERTTARAGWHLGSIDDRASASLYGRIRTLARARRRLYFERIRLRASARVLERGIGRLDRAAPTLGVDTDTRAEIFARLAAGDAAPARRLLDTFDVGRLTSDDLTRVSGGVYRVTLRPATLTEEAVDGVLRVVPDVDKAEYERWCAEFVSHAPGVVVSPVRVIEAPPSLQDVIRNRLDDEAGKGLRSDIFNLHQQLRRGPAPFKVTLAVWSPGQTGFSYLEDTQAILPRVQLLQMLRNVDRILVDTTWNHRDADHMAEWFDHMFRRFDFEMPVTAIAALVEDVRAITGDKGPAPTFRELVRELAIESGVNGFERFIPLTQDLVFARLPARVRTRLADLWAAAYLAGIDDLHANNWLIDGETITGIDLNHAHRAFAEGLADYSTDSPTGGRQTVSDAYRRVIARDISPAMRGWLGLVASGGACIAPGAGITKPVKHGIRARARFILALP